MYVKYSFLDWFEFSLLVWKRGLQKVSQDCILHKLFWEYILMQLRNGYLISQTNSSKFPILGLGPRSLACPVKKESAVNQKEQKL